MKKDMISKLLLTTVLLTLIFGCATSQGPKDASMTEGLPVITEVKLQENGLSIASNRHFVYTLYTGSDPYKTTIEIPEMLAGNFSTKMVFERAGITEIIPQQIDSPRPSMKFEVIFQTPSTVTPFYRDNVLTLVVKPEEKKVVAVPVETPVVKQEEPAAPPAVVQEPAAAEPPAKPAEEVKAAPMSPATEITKIEVQKGDGAVKVLITGNGSMKPNVFPLSGRIVVDVSDVALKASLPSGIVSPIKGIRAGKYKDKVRLVLDLKEKTRFEVASEGNTIEISLGKKEMAAAKAPEKEAPAKPAAAAKQDEPARTAEAGDAQQEAVKKSEAPKVAAAHAKAAGVETLCPAEGMKDEKRNYDFQDADVGSLVRFFAETGGCNYIIDPNDAAIKGKKVTLQLADVTWSRALDIILSNQKLGYRIDGNILWVAPESTFEAMAKEKAKARETEEDIEAPIVQEVLRISYSTAKDIQGAITSAKLLSKRAQITVDERMNTLIIRETPKNLDKIRDLMKIMDVAKPQVMIEAKIVQVSSNYSEALGIRWGGQFWGNSVVNPFGGSFSVNTPTVGAGPSTTNPGGAMAMTIGHANSVNVNLSLSALESIKKAKTLSNPKILTLDNEGATIQQGQTFFISTVSQAGTQTQQQQATLSLDVTPKITPDGYIQLKVKATDNALVSVNPPVVDTKSLDTQALVKNGETLVLGGIYKTSLSENEERLPILGKIPGLGWLFKTKNVTGPDVIELLIFITPTVVQQQGDGQGA